MGTAASSPSHAGFVRRSRAQRNSSSDHGGSSLQVMAVPAVESEPALQVDHRDNNNHNRQSAALCWAWIPPLRLRRGKRSSGCPCPLGRRAPSYEAMLEHPDFRNYALRHMLDDTFVCSVLEGDGKSPASSALACCEGIPNLAPPSDAERTVLEERLRAWEGASGAGLAPTSLSNTALHALRLSLPAFTGTSGFLPVFQRRLSLLRELGRTIRAERKARCQPFYPRPQVAPHSSSSEHGDVHLALTMGDVALKALSSLCRLVPLMSISDGVGDQVLPLVRDPFELLRNKLAALRELALYPQWSPMPASPEMALKFALETATASASPSLAGLAVTGGAHVGWKSLGASAGATEQDVTWQIQLACPCEDTIASIEVQWAPGEPQGATSQNFATPRAMAVELTRDGGETWHNATGGDGFLPMDHCMRQFQGTSRHRYPLCGPVARPGVTGVRIRMRGRRGGSHHGASIELYDVAVNVVDKSVRCFDILTVLREFQAFLIQSCHTPGLEGLSLSTLAEIGRSSGALEFILELLAVLMDFEGAGEGEVGEHLPEEAGSSFDELVRVVQSAAVRACRAAQRRHSEQIFSDATFDSDRSSLWVEVSEGGAVVTSVDSGNSFTLVNKCLRRGRWQWELRLEREMGGDETTCLGVAVNPVTNGCYENSHQMWMVRCYSGETYCHGRRQSLTVGKIHPRDSVRFTFDCEARMLAMEINGVDQGVVFTDVPEEVHPAVSFYGTHKSVRLLYLKRVDSSDDEEDDILLQATSNPRGLDCEEKPAEQSTDSGSQDVALPSSSSASVPSKSPASRLLDALASLGQWYSRLDEGGAESDSSFASALVSNEIEHRLAFSADVAAGSGNRQTQHRTYSEAATGAVSVSAVTAAAARTQRARDSPALVVESFSLVERIQQARTVAARRRIRHGVRAATLSGEPFGPTDGYSGNRTMSSLLERRRPPSTEEPFVVQPTAAVFSQLHSLLRRALAAKDGDRLLSLLTLVRINFVTLVDSRVDPTDMGLGPENEVTPRLLQLLKGLMTGDAVEHDSAISVRFAAVDTCAAGLPLLMPQLEDRLHLLLSLLHHSDEPCGDTHLGSGLEPAPVRLLGHVLCHFSRAESIIQLLSMYKEKDIVRSATKILFDILVASPLGEEDAGQEDEEGDEIAQNLNEVDVEGKGVECKVLDNMGEAPAVALARSKCIDPALGGAMVEGTGDCRLDILSLRLLSKMQQHLLCLIMEPDDEDDQQLTLQPPPPLQLLMAHYASSLMSHCGHELAKGVCSGPAVTNLLPPLLHGLCLCVHLPAVAEGILASLVELSKSLAKHCEIVPAVQIEARAIAEAARIAELASTEASLVLPPSGWYTVPGKFVVEEETAGYYTISEDGQLYSAITSSNTCATVDVGVSSGRAAWEFILESDSHSDECSVFGAAVMPLHSRCYNSSPNLWMRRAYNGVLYSQGRQLGASRTMSKIHPGDTIRCEVDMDEGTLRFSVNGEEQEGGFDGLEGEVFACVGSYRSGVKIRLVKAELLGVREGMVVQGSAKGLPSPRRGLALSSGAHSRESDGQLSPSSLEWASPPNSCAKILRGVTLSTDRKAMGLRRMIGIPSVLQSFPAHHFDWVTAGTSLTLFQKDSPPLLRVVSIEVSLSGSAGVSPSQADCAESVKPPLIFGLTLLDICDLRGSTPLGEDQGTWGWRVQGGQGSLWAGGQCISKAYGCSSLPLSHLDVVSLALDPDRATLSFDVNGVGQGVAFYLADSEDGKGVAAINGVDLGDLRLACSLSSEKQSLQILPHGLTGGHRWSLPVDLIHVIASLGGRACATMVAGHPQDANEVKVDPWLRSSILTGGLTVSVLDRSSEASLKRRLETPRESESHRTAQDQEHSGVVKVKLIRSRGVRQTHFWRPQPYYAQLLVTSCSSMECGCDGREIVSSARLSAVSSGANELVWSEDNVATLPISKDRCALELKIHSGLATVAKTRLPLAPGEIINGQATLVALDGGGDILLQIDYTDASLAAGTSPEHALEVSSDERYGHAVIEWLERVYPEPNFLKKALERTGSFSFPEAEGAFAAALLSHSGLLPEALAAHAQICSGTNIPEPSDDMISLWGRVKQLRAHFRTQKQHFKAHGVSADKNTQGEGVDIFQAYMAGIAKRCRFLLHLAPSVSHPAEASELYKESMAARTAELLQQLADGMSALPIPPTPALQTKLLRWRSEDRVPAAPGQGGASPPRQVNSEAWVLRMQSKLRRGIAMETVPDELPDDEGGLSSIDPSIAVADSEDEGEPQNSSGHCPSAVAMQLCALYVLTGGESAPPEAILDAMKKRAYRAHMRAFGLRQLSRLLGTLQLHTSRAEALIFLRPAFRGLQCAQGSDDVKLDSPARTQVTPSSPELCVHYLRGLEGLPGVSMNEVQQAFSEVYTVLAGFLAESFSRRQPRLTLTILGCWAMEFEARDCLFLVRSGILATLQGIISLSTLAESAAAASSCTLEPAGGYRTGDTACLWRPWSVESVRMGLQYGFVTCRALVTHMQQIPTDGVDAESLQSLAAMSTDASLQSPSSLLSLYSRIYSDYSAKLVEKQQSAEAALQAWREEVEAKSAALVDELIRAGVPLLETAENRRAKEVHLSELASVATVPVVETVACVFGRGVVFSPVREGITDHDNSVATRAIEDVPPQVAPDVATSSSQGESLLTCADENVAGTEDDVSRVKADSLLYFEVTILSPGEKTTIGVGLADPDHFPPTKHMPGWIDHSYGYHGDDGRKFGRERTAGTWPTWAEGDVIGCGFDPVRRAIWYTRNGTLLGDAFTNVNELQLVPVIGFHSNGESICANFGIAPFVYPGAQLSKIRDVARPILSQQLPLPPPPADTVDETVTRVNWSTSMAGKDESTVKLLQQAGWALLAYLLSTSTVRSHPGSEEPNPCTSSAPSSPLDRSADRGSPKNGGASSFADLDGEDREGSPSVPSPVRAIRERSLYGTPLRLMKAHILALHKDIFDVLLWEIRMGIRCMSSESPGSGWDESTRSNRASCLAMFSSEHGRRREGLAVLERSEVEPHVYRAILLLCSLRGSDPVRSQLVHGAGGGLKSILALLRIGSPRIQRCSLLLLRSLLPAVNPQEVDAALPAEWTCEEGNKAAAPISFVSILFATVTHGVGMMPPLSSSWNGTHPRLSPILWQCTGYEVGYLELCLSDSCARLLRALHAAPRWREHVTRILLVPIRTLAQRAEEAKEEDRANAIAALSIISTCGACLSPGVRVKGCGRSNCPTGTVVSYSLGEAKVSVAFDGEGGAIETVPVSYVQVLQGGVDSDPDTPAQPLTQQLVQLLLSLARSPVYQGRLLSFTLGAVLRLSHTSSESMLSALRDGVFEELLPLLSQIASRPIALPCLVTEEVLQSQWVQLQARTLSAHRLSPHSAGLCPLRREQRAVNTGEDEQEKSAPRAAPSALPSLPSDVYVLIGEGDGMVDSCASNDTNEYLKEESKGDDGDDDDMEQKRVTWGVAEAETSENESEKQAFPSCLPLTHSLSFEANAVAARQRRASTLASIFSVHPDAALAAIEAYGSDGQRAAKWLELLAASSTGSGSCLQSGVSAAYGSRSYAKSQSSDPPAVSDTATRLLGGMDTVTLSSTAFAEVDASLQSDSLMGSGSESGSSNQAFNSIGCLCEEDLVPIVALPAMKFRAGRRQRSDACSAPLSHAYDWVECGSLVVLRGAEGLNPHSIGIHGTVNLPHSPGQLKEDGRILLDILDQETGLTLGQLVSPLELSHSPTLYGRPASSKALLDLTNETDEALSILRSRSLLVHLACTGPAPPIPAVGGPTAVLKLMRLLAAGDMAGGTLMPDSPWGSSSSDICKGRLWGADAFGEDPSDTPSPLKALWQRLLSGENSKSEENIKFLGGVLTEEVLRALRALTEPRAATPHPSVSRESPRLLATMSTSSAAHAAHESLHPICAPLHYGGKLEVDPSSRGMVIKMDSRSATSGPELQLRFYSSEEDMVNGENPVRTMYGCDVERQARVRNKGLEFFKVEEADGLLAPLEAVPLFGPIEDGSSFPSAASQSTSFRSFVMPGMKELWFRFDAGVGTDKPPIRLASLSGSCEQSSEGGITTIKPGDEPETLFGVGRGMSLFEEEEEEACGSRHCGQEDSPACRVAAVNAQLAPGSGHWMYEVEVKELEGNDAIISIGWSSSDAASAPPVPRQSELSGSEIVCSVGCVSSKWTCGDIICAEIDLNPSTAPMCTFLLNGVEVGKCPPPEASTLRPFFALVGRSALAINFGFVPFRTSLVQARGAAHPVTDRPLPEGSSPSPNSSVSWAVPLARRRASLSANWGFRFRAEPLTGVCFRVVRDMQLVCQLGINSRTSAARLRSRDGAEASAPRVSAATDVSGPSGVVSIWRPKVDEGWFSVGDVAVPGASTVPPPGAIVVKGDNTGCLVSKPAKFRLIYQDKATGYTIWRPMPRRGQVALGDFTCVKKFSKALMAGAVRCVAAWAVEEAPVLQKIWQDPEPPSASGSTALWAVENGMGSFFGSQTGGRMGRKELCPLNSSDHRKSEKKRRKKRRPPVSSTFPLVQLHLLGSATEQTSGAGASASTGGPPDSGDDDDSGRVKLRLGVGRGFKIRGIQKAMVANDWCEEEDIIGEPGPSTTWCAQLLAFLLDQPRLRHFVLHRAVFLALSDYIRSAPAPAALRVIPLLATLVRGWAEFADGPPDMTNLQPLVNQTLERCDRILEAGRGGPERAWSGVGGDAWRRLAAVGAPEVLLLLTDLAVAVFESSQQTATQAALKKYVGSEEPASLNIIPSLPMYTPGETDPVVDLLGELVVGGNSSGQLAKGPMPPADHHGRGRSPPPPPLPLQSPLYSKSRCMQWLLDVSELLLALRKGWPPLERASSNSRLTALLCEAWDDAISLSHVVHIPFPFQVQEDGSLPHGKLQIDGARGFSVFMDPRCQLPRGYSLTLSGRDKTEVITYKTAAAENRERNGYGFDFNGEELSYAVTASQDCEEEEGNAGSSLLRDCNFIMRTGKGGIHVAEVLESDHPMTSVAIGDKWEARLPGAQALSVDWDFKTGLPQGFELEAVDGEGTVVSSSSDIERFTVKGESVTIRIVAAKGSEQAGVLKVEEMPWGWALYVRQLHSRFDRLKLLLETGCGEGPPRLSLEDAWRGMQRWTCSLDASLMERLSCVPKERAMSTFNFFSSQSEHSFQHPGLADMPLELIHLRTALLMRLNARVKSVLPVIDLGSNIPESPGFCVREQSHLILPQVKALLVQMALDATQGSGGDGVTVVLDNELAAASRARGERDPATSHCIFVQAFRQLERHGPQVLTTLWDGDRVFKVQFVGEEGVDAGGVFREGVTRMVEDLFSPHFDLFAPCPNARHAAGQNNEKYVPNIRHNGMLAMAQLRFVGRLMGMSLRTHLCLPFELPSLVWKKLLGQHVGLEDLRAIDTIACQFLSAIRDCGGDGITDEAAFRDVYGEKLFFTYTGSDGAERELLEGGSSRRVTFDDRLQYCDLVQRHRLHEFDTHIAAITKGLQEVVPLNSLRLYTAQQAEVAFAGEPHFDLDWWRAHTDYKGFAEDDLTVELFWKVLESFSPQDKSGFVRFAWARSRLPPKAYWTCNMKLSNRGAEQLPQSHTCFFSVELPEYKTEEEMRQGLLTAIHCSSGILNV